MKIREVNENKKQFIALLLLADEQENMIDHYLEKESLNALDGKDVLLVFPTNHKKNSTVRILKTPKTESSVRKIFLPKSVANMLVDWKVEQDEMKEILGDEYMDYNLVMASTFGLPLGDGAIRGPLKKLIEDYNLPPVVFHSFRHSSVTYKLKLNGGDIKAVQGDSGHAQVNMVTDVYSHILDDDRRKNAELFEEAFYEKKNLDPQMHVQQENNNATVADEIDPELLHILCPTNLIAPFGDRLSDTHQINLLKRICSQERSPHLSGNHHNRRTVNHGISNAGDSIRGTGTAGNQTDSHFTRHTGKTLCRMSSSLFVTNQYMI